MSAILELVPLIAWAGLWMTGGWLLTAALFRLSRSELGLVGLAIGLILQTWLANLMAHALPIILASWVSASLVCALGALALTLRHGPVRISARQVLRFGLPAHAVHAHR
jgi:hypothetical protein